MDRWVSTCLAAARAGAAAAQAAGAVPAMTKGDPHVGHHAIVSAADFASQRAILHALAETAFPLRVIAEESTAGASDGLVLGREAWAALDTQGVFVVDELDGSSSFAVGHPEWSVSVAYVDRLAHLAAAVVAPSVYGGGAFWAGRGAGSWLTTGDGSPSRLRVTESALEDAYVLIGPDAVLSRYPRHNRFLLEIGERARTVNMNGSCALALSLVAAGRANALVQPLQSPWDWAAGKLLVEEAGGTVVFYEMEGQSVRRLDRLRSTHYDPTQRAVGFVAGPPPLVEVLFDALLKSRPQA